MTDAEQKAVFMDWLGRYEALVFKVVWSYAATPMDREDLFQEIVLQVWNSISSFRSESSPSTWVYRVALNTAIKWSKKERRHAAIDLPPGLFTDHPAWADERLAWLYDAIRRLDKVDRSIALMLLDGFSYKEMGAVLGIKESHVGVKVYRIKQHLIQQSKVGGHYGT